MTTIGETVLINELREAGSRYRGHAALTVGDAEYICDLLAEAAIVIESYERQEQEELPLEEVDTVPAAPASAEDTDQQDAADDGSE